MNTTPARQAAPVHPHELDDADNLLRYRLKNVADAAQDATDRLRKVLSDLDHMDGSAAESLMRVHRILADLSQQTELDKLTEAVAARTRLDVVRR